jgi:hypothetical protein
MTLAHLTCNQEALTQIPAIKSKVRSCDSELLAEARAMCRVPRALSSSKMLALVLAINPNAVATAQEGKTARV